MKTLVLVLLFSSSFILHAAELKVEPVYGVERTQRHFPKPTRYKTETFFGVRALYGVPVFSFELELNLSHDKEDFPDSNLEVTYKSQKAMLGARINPLANEFLSYYFRAGLRASKQSRDIKENGENRTEDDPLNFDPYAGVGGTLRFGANFALNAGATLIYNKNAEESEKFDTRYTFSFTMKVGNK